MLAMTPSPDWQSAARSAFRSAVSTAGGQVAFARVCGCSQGNVSSLLRRGSVLPARFVLAVEAATGVSRHALRPDIYPAFNGPTLQCFARSA